eukprot:scaffold1536_cov166-Amphora_coffeaeformis.AAC.4
MIYPTSKVFRLSPPPSGRSAPTTSNLTLPYLVLLYWKALRNDGILSLAYKTGCDLKCRCVLKKRKREGSLMTRVERRQRVLWLAGTKIESFGASAVEMRPLRSKQQQPPHQKTPARTGRMKGPLLLFVLFMFRRAVCFTLRRQPTFHTQSSQLASTKARPSSIKDSKGATTPANEKADAAKLLNLSSVTKEDLTAIITSWGHPKFRANQIWQWIRVNGVTDVEKMTNIPKDLRAQLDRFSRPSILQVELEQISKDGTIKRAYKCHDGQLIESVLMPYEDGRYTACISSQAGCAQGCVFCATGQMGFARQLTSDEIFEQVARFAAELKQREETQEETKNKSHGKETRLSSTFRSMPHRKRCWPCF